MAVYIGLNGQTYMTADQPFAGGGEGDIYEITGSGAQAAKIYKSEKRTTEKERKLSFMVNIKPNVIEQYAWPLDVLYQDGRFVGFVMPRVQGKEKLRNIYVYDRRDKRWSIYVAIAKNLAAAVHNVHEIGQVIGDLNPENILVDRQTGLVTLVDTDSYHIADGAGNVYRCGVGMPEFVAPELQGIHFSSEPLPTFTKETDAFALSVLMFALLMNGAHPFACKTMSGSSSKFQPIDNMSSGTCAYFAESSKTNIDIPKYAPPLTMLPLDIQSLFHRSFVEGHKNVSIRPTAEEWYYALERLEQDMAVCAKNAEHQYYKFAPECPWCAVEEKMAPAVSSNTRTRPVSKTPHSPTPVPQQIPASPPASAPRPVPASLPIKNSKIWIALIAIGVVVLAGIICILSVKTIEKNKQQAAKNSITLFPQLGHSGRVSSVAFSPDGTKIVSGSDDQTIKLWDITNGREIRTFPGHSNSVNSVAFSPDGTKIVSGSDDQTIKLWDVISGREIHTFPGHSDWVRAVTFNPDGTKIVSGSDDRTIKLWDVTSGREIRTFRGHLNRVFSVAFSPDGTKIVSGSDDQTIKLWDVISGWEIYTFSESNGGVFSVVFSPDGTRVVSGFYDRTIKLWDITSGQEIRTFIGQSRGMIPVAFSPDGSKFVSGSNNGTIKLWDAANGQEISAFFEYSNGVTSVAVSPSGRQLASGFSNGMIILWDITSGREIRAFSGHSNSVISVAFSTDGTQLVSGSYDTTIKLWNVIGGWEIRTFRGHSSGVRSAALNLNGNMIVSSSYDGTVKLWDISTGWEMRTFVYSDKISSVAFSPDGGQIVSGSDDGTVKLWDVIGGWENAAFFGHSSGVTSVVFSPDGTRLVSGSYDRTVKLWDVTSGQEIVQFVSFADGEWAVIAPDGYYNASEQAAQYINIRIDNEVYGITQQEQKRERFNKPDIVAQRLSGGR